jgi:hypothetical protein
MANFIVTYPLYFLTKGDDVAIVTLKHKSAEAVGNFLPVFTDEKPALAFRDECFPRWPLASIAHEAFFSWLLVPLKDRIFGVAFNPHRTNRNPVTISVGELIAQFGKNS